MTGPMTDWELLYKPGTSAKSLLSKEGVTGHITKNICIDNTAASVQRNNNVNSNDLYPGENIPQTLTESGGTDTVYNGKVPRLLSGTDEATITSYSLIEDDQENVSDSED
ncbi:unnamed protein product, partial [Owenia fusiformis]